MEKTGKIYGINGPVITVKGDVGFSMGEMVYAGEEKLIGEVISLTKEFTTIQVYEETSGMKPGEMILTIRSPEQKLLLHPVHAFHRQFRKSCVHLRATLRSSLIRM